jgi:prepilin-type N-terminal cleavage/methylation domain-containing protein
MNKINLIHIKNQQGFTLIELVSMLVLLGLVSAIAVSKTSDFQSSTNLVTTANVLKNHLRYAQMYAMNSDSASFCRINFTGSPLNNYELEVYDSGWTDLNLPGLQSNVYDMDNIYVSDNTTVVFNIRGIPMNTATLASYRTSNTTITLTDGTNSVNITIRKNTGFTSR